MKFRLLRIGGKALRDPLVLGDKLVQDTYDDEKQLGFSVTQVRREVIRGSFLEKRKRHFEVLDAANISRVVEVETVSFTRFEIRPGLGFLVVFDTHAPISTLIARLGLLSQFRVTIEAASIPLNAVLDLTASKGFKAQVVELTGSNVSVSPDVDAVVRLHGKVALATAKAASFLGRRGEVVSARLACESSDEKFFFSWKPAGSFEIDPAPNEVEQFLVDLMQNSAV